MDSSGATRLILVVDDDESTTFILRKRLERAGYQVAVAANMDEGLKALDERPFDLVLSDVMMPQASGMEFCRRIRACGRLRHIPVILVSARDEVESIVAGLDAGADDYLPKPFNPEELLARVRTQLRIKDLQEQLLEAEQQKVVGQLAGAAAHEINQPLTILMGYAEMLLKMVEGEPELAGRVKAILQSADEIAGVVKRIQRLRGYRTKPYVDQSHIVDLQAPADGEP